MLPPHERVILETARRLGLISPEDAAALAAPRAAGVTLVDLLAPRLTDAQRVALEAALDAARGGPSVASGAPAPTAPAGPTARAAPTAFAAPAAFAAPGAFAAPAPAAFAGPAPGAFAAPAPAALAGPTSPAGPTSSAGPTAFAAPAALAAPAAPAAFAVPAPAASASAPVASPLATLSFGEVLRLPGMPEAAALPGAPAPAPPSPSDAPAPPPAAPAASPLTTVAFGEVLRPPSAPEGAPAAAAEPRPVLPQRPAADLPPGSTFGRYELRRELARGGMGVVFAAWDPTLEREVALKVMLGGAGAGPIARFKVEALAAARVRHENVVAVHDMGVVNGRPYLTMDLVAGESLGARLQRGPLDPAEAARIIADVARGLHRAHELGVLHRDLKPGNVLLRADGAALLTDFGLAKLALQEEQALTRTGEVMGTPVYIPPEQAEGNAVRADARTDVYGLGATLYHALTGTPPQSGPPAVILARVVRGELDPPSSRRPDLPRAVEVICLKAMALRPEGRHASAAELADALDGWRASLAGRPATAGLIDRGARALRRRALPLALVVGLASLVVLGLGLREAWRAPRARARAALAEHEAWAAGALRLPLDAREVEAGPPPAELERRGAALDELARQVEWLGGELGAVAPRLERLRALVAATARARAVLRDPAVGGDVPALDDARGALDLAVDALALRLRGDPRGALERAVAARARDPELAGARWLELELLLELDPAGACARAVEPGLEPARARDLVSRAHAALIARAASAVEPAARDHLRDGLAAARIAARERGADVAALGSAKVAALEGAAPVWSATLAATALEAEPAALRWLAQVVSDDPRVDPGPALRRAVEADLDRRLEAWAALGGKGDDTALEAALQAEETASGAGLVQRRDGPRIQQLLRRCVATGRIAADGGDPHAALACLRAWRDDGRVDEGFGDVGANGADALFRAEGVDALLAAQPLSRARALIAWRRRGPPRRIDQATLDGWLRDMEATLLLDGGLDDLAPCYRWQPLPVDELEAALPREPQARARDAARIARLGRAGRAGLLAWQAPARDLRWWSALLSYLRAERCGGLAQGAREPLAPEWTDLLAPLAAWSARGASGRDPRRGVHALWLGELAAGHEALGRLADAERLALEADAAWGHAPRSAQRIEHRWRARALRSRALRALDRGVEAWAYMEPFVRATEEVGVLIEAAQAARAAGQLAAGVQLLADAERRIADPAEKERLRAARAELRAGVRPR